MEAVKDRPTRTELILPFVNSACTVLSTMAGLTTTIGQPYLKHDAMPKHDVSGIIGFCGGVEGSVVLSFEFKAAGEIVKAFSGTAFPPSSPDFADAVGELANMIVGSAKKNLGVAASISVPTVVIGSGHLTARLGGVPCVVIPFSTPLGDFVVEVNIKYSV